MKTIKHSYYLSLLILPVFFINSCISPKKYNTALDEVARMRVDSSELASKLADTEYEKTKADLALKEDIKLKNQKLNSMKEKIAAYNELKAQLNDLIPTLENDDLETFIEKGYFHISLPHRVLFNTGENSLTKGGEKVLVQLSQKLKNEDADIMILGHTDSLPYGNTEKDNWDLSFDRAHAVMMAMTENGFPKEQIILAGRGKYDPFMENETQVGRLLNRRIEIILMPDIEKLESVKNELFTETEM